MRTVVVDHLGGDETPLEVGVDLARCFRRRRSRSNRPRSCLLVTTGQVTLQTEGVVSGVNDSVEARLFLADGCEQLGSLVMVEGGKLGFDLGIEEQGVGWGDRAARARNGARRPQAEPRLALNT